MNTKKLPYICSKEDDMSFLWVVYSEINQVNQARGSSAAARQARGPKTQLKSNFNNFLLFRGL